MAVKREISASLFGLLDPGLAWLEDEGVNRFQPLVSTAEIDVFRSLSKLLDPSPRRLKRILNVYALAIEAAKQMPLSEDDSKACAWHVHKLY